MGVAVAKAFVRAGFPSIIWVEGRSATTLVRAGSSGAILAHSLADVLSKADLLFSIVPSEFALGVARRVAEGIGTIPRRPVYVDANPLSSERFSEISGLVSGAGLPFLDAGIFGIPPTADRRPLMVVSGDRDDQLAPLDGVAFDIVRLRAPAGAASLVKLLECGMSKGVNLWLALLYTAAERGGVLDAFGDVIARTRPDLASRAERSIPWIPADATRSLCEIAELERQLGALGLPRSVARGAGEILHAIAASPLGTETREKRDSDRDMLQTVRVLAAEKPAHSTSPGSPGDSFVLTLMTDDIDEAMRGQAAGVDRIGPDLETLGKSDRQNNIGTRVSVHEQSIVSALNGKMGSSLIFCRIDPLNPASGDQIDELIGMGAQSLMLPYFHTVHEVEAFVRMVDGRANTTILCETAAAVFRMGEMVRVAGVDEIHIGLTDLMLSTKVGSRYELLLSDTLEAICAVVSDAGKPLHLAGVARVDDDTLSVSSDMTLARYAELGVRGSLITRAFSRKCPTAEDFAHAVTTLRARVDYWATTQAAERRRMVDSLRRLAREARAAGRPLP